MKENLIQPRVYTDTMRGGEFKFEMREKLGLVGSFDTDMDDLDLKMGKNTDYISRQDAINIANDWLLNCFKVQKQDKSCGLIRRLEDSPSADVVQVIRCGQCKYWQDNDGDYGYCYAKDGHGFGHAWGKNDFCSYGKMR